MIKDDKNSGNKNSCEDDKKVGIKIVRIKIVGRIKDDENSGNKNSCEDDKKNDEDDRKNGKDDRKCGNSERKCGDPIGPAKVGFCDTPEPLLAWARFLKVGQSLLV